MGDVGEKGSQVLTRVPWLQVKGPTQQMPICDTGETLKKPASSKLGHWYLPNIFKKQNT